MDSNPDAHLPSLATALTSLSTRLEKAGQREEAIAAAQEAIHVKVRMVEPVVDGIVSRVLARLEEMQICPRKMDDGQVPGAWQSWVRASPGRNTTDTELDRELGPRFAGESQWGPDMYINAHCFVQQDRRGRKDGWAAGVAEESTHRRRQGAGARF